MVFIEGGPGAIRSASGNGLIWTIDGKARGANDLKPGKIMYATSRAVGRVAELQRVDGDLAVTLAPVTLTEVFRDAHFNFDREIDDSALVYQEIPDLPGAISIPEIPPANSKPTVTKTIGPAPGRDPAGPPSGAVFAVGAPRLAPDSGGLLPPAREANYTVTVGDWEAQPYRSAGRLGLKVGHAYRENLKVFVDFSMLVNKLRVRTDVRIAGGRLASNSTFAVDGISGIAIDLAAGAANGADDDKKVRVEVPLEMNIPIPGEPLVFSAAFKFIVATAIGGKNSTLTANGEWALNGSIGLVAGEIQTPTLSVVKSIMDSISGIALGTSGLIFAVESKIQFGIGTPAAFAGPYAKLVVDIGVTNGSALGAPLARCVGATLDAKAGGGFGVTLEPSRWEALRKLLPTKVKFEFESEKLWPFFHRSQILPNVPLCLG